MFPSFAGSGADHRAEGRTTWIGRYERFGKEHDPRSLPGRIGGKVAHFLHGKRHVECDGNCLYAGCKVARLRGNDIILIFREYLKPGAPVREAATISIQINLSSYLYTTFVSESPTEKTSKNVAGKCWK